MKKVIIFTLLLLLLGCNRGRKNKYEETNSGNLIKITNYMDIDSYSDIKDIYLLFIDIKGKRVINISKSGDPSIVNIDRELIWPKDSVKANNGKIYITDYLDNNRII